MMIVAMRKTEIVDVVAVLSISLLMTTCGRKEEHPVAEFTVRAISARGAPSRWDFDTQRGMVRIGEELGADVKSLRAADSADARRQVIEIGRAQVDLVFCTGSVFEKTLYTESAAFPGTVFVMLPGQVRGSNVAGIQFLPEEAGYLAGSVASALAPTNRVGVLRGDGHVWLELLEEGFGAGFRAHTRRASVQSAQGVEGVESLVDDGIEVALYASDVADPEVLSAARAAGLKLMSSQRGVMDANPDLVVATVEVDVAEAMVRVARDVRDGVFSARVFAFDVGSGVVDVRLSDRLPEEVLEGAGAALADARDEVTAGYVAFDDLGL